MTMNKSNQLEPMLNAFLSDLAVLNIKVHNLHWNVEGREFSRLPVLPEPRVCFPASDFPCRRSAGNSRQTG